MRMLAVLAWLWLALPAVAEEGLPAPLPVLNIESDAISVMGVSSGGYMATQLAVAWPERFSGLAVFSAGPWGCAQGSLSRALMQCMQTRLGPPNLDALERRYTSYLNDERVGSPTALAEQRVYLWHGGNDTVVDPLLGDLLAEQYREWLANPQEQLKVVRTQHAAHGWPVNTSQETASCSTGGRPHLLACDLDGAGQAVRWIYGERLQPPEDEGRGMLMPFDQSPYHEGRGLAERGYVFVPKTCEEGAPCALAVALHGCDMSSEQIGDTFARHSGLNSWAAESRLVVLYPQTKPTLPNPKACWDWWGYDQSSWQRNPMHDSRQGRQAQAIKAMVDHLANIPAS